MTELDAPRPFLGHFDPEKAITIEPAMNGGFVVRHRAELGQEHQIIGAFSHSEDLIIALVEALRAAYGVAI